MSDETSLHMENPQFGDRFHEMYSFWVHVIKRDGDKISVREYHPPCAVPVDGKRRDFESIEAFKTAYAYSTPGLGYTVLYSDNKASDWEPME